MSGPNPKHGFSGPNPKHGLSVTVSSGPHPKHGNPRHSKAARGNPAPEAQHSQSDSDPFSRTEIVSVRLPSRKPHPFSVLVSIHTPGAILIESVEISICEGEETLCNIPVSTSTVELSEVGDSEVFRLTDRQLAAIAEHLEDGSTIKVVVRYLAAERSELKISIIDKDSHHKLGYVLAMVGLGLAVQALTKRLSRSR